MSQTIPKGQPIIKRSPRPKQATMMHTTIQGHCPTPQNSPTYLPMNAAAAAPAKPHRTKIQGILPDKRKVPCGWPACLRRQPPRVAFKNNDIYMVNDEEGNNYEEPRERHPKVQYKLKICDNPASKQYAPWGRVWQQQLWIYRWDHCINNPSVPKFYKVLFL